MWLQFRLFSDVIIMNDHHSVEHKQFWKCPHTDVVFKCEILRGSLRAPEWNQHWFNNVLWCYEPYKEEIGIETYPETCHFSKRYFTGKTFYCLVTFEKIPVFRDQDISFWTIYLEFWVYFNLISLIFQIDANVPKATNKAQTTNPSPTLASGIIPE